MIAFDTDIELVEIGESYYFRSSYPEGGRDGKYWTGRDWKRDAADFDEMAGEAGDSDDLSSTTERAGAA